MSKPRTSLMSNQEWFESCIKESKSTKEAIIRMGYDTPTNYYTSFKQYLKRYNTDISHFMSFKDILKYRLTNPGKYQLVDILVEDFQGSVNGNSLKDRLYKAGLKTKACEMCGQDENWITGKICMILDHKNGNNRDNRIENLRILCPNCDTTLPTFKARNKKKQSCNKKKIEEYNSKQDTIKNVEILKDDIRKLILESGIDFTKSGWGVKLSKILKRSPAWALRTTKTLLPEFYKENCFKYKY